MSYNGAGRCCLTNHFMLDLWLSNWLSHDTLGLADSRRKNNNCTASSSAEAMSKRREKRAFHQLIWERFSGEAWASDEFQGSKQLGWRHEAFSFWLEFSVYFSGSHLHSVFMFLNVMGLIGIMSYPLHFYLSHSTPEKWQTSFLVIPWTYLFSVTVIKDKWTELKLLQQLLLCLLRNFSMWLLNVQLFLD